MVRCLLKTCLIAVAVLFVAAGHLSDATSPQPFLHYQEVHSIASIPKQWKEQERAPRNALLDLRIGLRQQNIDAFLQKVLDISTPSHPSYGMFMSQAEIDDMLRPASDSAQLVLKWLKSHRIKGVLDNNWVRANVTVTQANKLLRTQYSTYHNMGSGNQVIRTSVYHLPTILADHVDFISPTTMFPMAFRSTSAIVDKEPHAINSSCRDTITISCLEELYRLDHTHPTCTSDKNNSLGVAGFDGEFANYQDLQSFLADQQPAFLHSNITFISVKGGLNSQNLSEAGSEANLDVQFARGLAPQYETLFYSAPPIQPPFLPSRFTPNNSNEPFEILVDFLLNQQELPQTLSISYGDEEQSVQKKYAQRVCTGFAALGARGTSVIVASGDYGVGDGSPDPANNTCYANFGKKKPRFLPTFPASCPYVTAVGATTSFNPEVAVTRFGSGGGFSWHFARPQYQDTVVSAYLKHLPKGLYNGLYNPAGRAIPDVAAQGDHYRIWLDGKTKLTGGTSASTPTFAAVITLLNGERLSQGKRPLGFLNPWLYAQGKHALNDIVFGNNTGCGTPGFPATRGWDPVTGLGTPDFVRMLKAAPP